jgi:hypothetical protein
MCTWRSGSMRNESKACPLLLDHKPRSCFPCAGIDLEQVDGEVPLLAGAETHAHYTLLQVVTLSLFVCLAVFALPRSSWRWSSRSSCG